LFLPYLLSKQISKLREDVEITARNPMAAKKEFARRKRDGK
jgi:outer membrane murein-binding lipoprotein Lpp